ncbi:MFS transporter [Paradesulfitobacterium aromaticivorans]
MSQSIKANHWFDEQKFNRFHVLLLLITGSALIFDGYDSQIIAYIMPKVLGEWHLSPVVAGSLASYGFLGLMIGAAGFGMISDRIGRKKSLMLSIGIFSLFSGLTFFAPNFKAFVTLRFLAGLGMGGAMPIAITLVSEFAPAKIRAKAVTGMFGGFTLGWAVAGLMAMLVIPSFGWRPLLLMGLLPVLIIPVIAIYLPESVRFLSHKGRYAEAISNMQKIERMAGISPRTWREQDFTESGATGAVKAADGSKSGDGLHALGGLKVLFSPGLRWMTVLVWLTYFFNLLVIYGLASWLPSLLVKSGFSLVKSYSYGMIQSLGATAGGFLLGWVMDRFGRKAGLSLFYFLGGLALWVFAFATSNLLLLLAGAATGVFIIGTQIAQHVITGEIYPTQVRSSGVGWALTIGRLGSIIGPLLGGLIQMGNFSFGQYFLIFSIPAFLCAALVLLYRINVKGEGLETINQKLSVAADAQVAPQPTLETPQ